MKFNLSLSSVLATGYNDVRLDLILNIASSPINKAI